MHRRKFLRREFLLLGAGVTAAGLLPARASAASARDPLPPRAKWTPEQVRGRAELERLFARRQIRPEHRDRIFEAVVHAVRQGHRDHEAVAREAKAYLQRMWPDVPNWVYWIEAVLGILAKIISIALLFIL